MIFDIPECNFHTLQDKLAKIERKAKKYNCEFNFNVVNTEIREKKIRNANGTESTYNIKYYIVDVSGTAKINNWQFLATITHYETGNVICGYQTNIAIPERYKKCKPYCEHCQSIRNRKDTYLVYNTETQEIKQVGKTCLKDFTNGLSAEHVANFESFFKEIEDARDDYSFLHEYQDNYFKKMEMLKLIYECVRIFGYHKTDSQYSTKSRVLNYYHALRHEYMTKENDFLLDEMEKVNFNADRNENQVEIENALKWISEVESNSQYLDNLKVICSLDYFEKHHIGILCSLFTAYFKAIEKENERKKASEKVKDSDFIGKVNEKVTVSVIDCKCVYSYETQYGYNYIYNMIDNNNNVIVWKTSKIIELKAFTIKGTIKALNEYKGINQTELTRCKII